MQPNASLLKPWGWFSGAKCFSFRGSNIIKATKGMGKMGIAMLLWHFWNPPLMLFQQQTTKLQCAQSQGCRLDATRYHLHLFQNRGQSSRKKRASIEWWKGNKEQTYSILVLFILMMSFSTTQIIEIHVKTCGKLFSTRLRWITLLLAPLESYSGDFHKFVECFIQ